MSAPRGERVDFEEAAALTEHSGTDTYTLVHRDRTEDLKDTAEELAGVLGTGIYRVDDEATLIVTYARAMYLLTMLEKGVEVLRDDLTRRYRIELDL